MLYDQDGITLKGYSALLNVEYNMNSEQANKVLEYVLQTYNKYRYGYEFNSEIEAFYKLKRLYIDHDSLPQPTEKQFYFAIERISQFATYLDKKGEKTFSVGSFRRYIAGMLKEKIDVESVIRYLWNEGIITYVDEELIHLHLE